MGRPCRGSWVVAAWSWGFPRPLPQKQKKRSTPIKETPEIAGGRTCGFSVGRTIWRKLSSFTLPHATITKIVGSTWLPVWALVPAMGFWVAGLEILPDFSCHSIAVQWFSQRIPPFFSVGKKLKPNRKATEMMSFPSSFEKEVSLQSGPLPLEKGATYNSTYRGKKNALTYL